MTPLMASRADTSHGIWTPAGVWGRHNLTSMLIGTQGRACGLRIAYQTINTITCDHPDIDIGRVTVHPQRSRHQRIRRILTTGDEVCFWVTSLYLT